jgi:glycosyltransferase involved in cell wall biosynthesis
MVAQFYPPTVGGEERMVHDLSVELSRRGHRVAVATLWHEGLPEYEEMAGVHVYRIRSSLGRLTRLYTDPSRHHAPPAVDPGAATALRRIAALERPDIVHGHNWLVYSYLPLKRANGPALVVSLHDYSLICSNKRLFRRGEPCTGPGPVKCLDCSVAYYGAAKGPAITIANWMLAAGERALVDLFLPVSVAVADAARLVDHGDDHLVIPNFLRNGNAAVEAPADFPDLPDDFILFAGDVTPDKGVPVLLRAHRSLEGAPPLVLIGRAREPAVLGGAGRGVHSVGPLPHELVLRAWRRCAIAVVPSIVPEAFGLVALEAMAAGRPVVASRTGGLSDVVVDGETGLLVAPGSTGELRAALARLLADSDLRRAMGDAGRARAKAFSAARVVPRIERAYEAVLAKRRRRASQT